jgi:hypothetical protein
METQPVIKQLKTHLTDMKEELIKMFFTLSKTLPLGKGMEVFQKAIM